MAVQPRVRSTRKWLFLQQLMFVKVADSAHTGARENDEIAKRLTGIKPSHANILTL